MDKLYRWSLEGMYFHSSSVTEVDELLQEHKKGIYDATNLE